jgi:predicted ferric reductase
MKPIKTTLWFYLLLLSALWWLTDTTAWGNLPNVFAWRAVLMQYSGVLGIGVMSLAMLLALRPVRLEPALGGLDKMYRLHKWLGIAGLVLSVSHWLMAQGPKWLVDLGWLTRPARGPRPVLLPGSVQQLLASQHGWAEGVGEWAFYAAVLLMVLALIKRFPYRYFFKTHYFLAVAYLALVLHSVVLMNFDYWGSWLGPVMAALMLGGSYAAVKVLLGRVGAHRQVDGQVVGTETMPDLQVLKLDVQLQPGWPGHEAGQFAFLSLHKGEGAHPFTITSVWRNDGRLTFIIKALGDYTGTLAQRVRVGDAVSVQGPYGRFNFAGATRRQIWVGGGIGITPFVARMQALAGRSDGKTVDLFHTTAVLDAQAMAHLEHDAQAAGVNLHVFHDSRDGQLTAARLTQQVPDWREADVWFCGPARFGHALRTGLTALGLPPGQFHQELFEMR